MSLVTFNDDVKTIYECVPVNEVKELTAETYRPDCCTALYDAMGMSLNALRKKVAEEDKVLVTVVTDGYENASKEYSGKAIKALVDELKAKGWVFAYIGANQDVKAVAATISITNVMNFETTSAGAQMMTDRVNRSRERLYNCMTEPDFSAAFVTTSFCSAQNNLNEIRFKGWSDKEWLDNDYIREFRTYIDARSCGKIEVPTLLANKEILHSKFVVGHIEPAHP